MRQGQITVFIILGLVLVIAVTFLIFISRELIEPPTTEVVADEALARSCLVRVTETSLGALRNDSVIRLDEGGPVETPYPFNVYYRFFDSKNLSEEYPLTFTARDVNNVRHPIGQALGRPYYIGLCDRQGANALHLFSPQRYFCDSSVYHMRQEPQYSIQHQLEVSINNQMANCIAAGLGIQTYIIGETQVGPDGTTIPAGTELEERFGRSEVVIQNQGITIRWNNPEIQYSPPEPLHAVWKAIRETTRNESQKAQFSPDRERDGGFPDRQVTCCETVSFRQLPAENHDGLYPPKSPGFPYNIWEYSVAGSVYSRIFLENRAIAVEKSVQLPNIAQPVDYYLDVLSHNDTCRPTPDVNLPLTEFSEIESDDLRRCEYDTYYTFDDDLLTVRYEEFVAGTPVNTWRPLAPQNIGTCGYDLASLREDPDIAWSQLGISRSSIANIQVPCEPTLMSSLRKHDLNQSTGRDYQPHINYLEFHRRCFAVDSPSQPLGAIFLNMTDVAGSYTLVNITEPLPAASSLTFTVPMGVDYDCSCMTDQDQCETDLENGNPVWSSYGPLTNNVCINGKIIDENHQVGPFTCECLDGPCFGATP